MNLPCGDVTEGEAHGSECRTVTNDHSRKHGRSSSDEGRIMHLCAAAQNGARAHRYELTQVRVMLDYGGRICDTANSHADARPNHCAGEDHGTRANLARGGDVSSWMHQWLEAEGVAADHVQVDVPSIRIVSHSEDGVRRGCNQWGGRISQYRYALQSFPGRPRVEKEFDDVARL
jgi:hypothetical protein